MRKFKVLREGMFVFCKKGNIVYLIRNDKNGGKSWWKLPQFGKKHEHLVMADVDFILGDGGIKEIL